MPTRVHMSRMVLGPIAAGFLLLVPSAASAQAPSSHPHPLPAPPSVAPETVLDRGWPGPLRMATDPGVYVDHEGVGDFNLDNKNPPDPHGGVGPRGVLQVNNKRVKYSLKDGTIEWQVEPLEDFFTEFETPGGLVDPRAAYDSQTQRFFAISLQTRYVDGDPGELRSYVHLAVSKNSHPAAGGSADWYCYRLDVTLVEGATRYGIDYPGMGFDAGALYVTGNMFTLPISGGASFRNCSVIAIDKLQAAQGALVWNRVVTPNVGSYDFATAFTLQPATVIGSASPGNVAYFCEVPYFGPTTSVRLWSLVDPLGAPALSSVLVPVPTWGGTASFAPQCGGTVPVRTWSPTAQGNAFWRDGSLWFSHAGAASGRSVVRWYRVDTNGYPAAMPSLGESGAFDGGPGVWTYQPAIGGNALGDVAIVFTQSDALTCPMMMYTARRADTGAFTTPAPLAVSTAAAGKDPNTSWAPWGDYGGVAEDPIDHGLWVTHEVVRDPAAGHWNTGWAHLRFETSEVGWPLAGRNVRSAQTEVLDPVVVPDGAGGLLAAWREAGTIWVQRLTADGGRAEGWSERGVPAFTGGLSAPAGLTSVSDSAGGVYLGWRSGSQGYLTRITAAGAVAAGWPAAGKLLGFVQSVPRLTSDGLGGVIAVLDDAGVHAHRFSSSGLAEWGSSGVTLDPNGYAPTVVPDGGGGAAIAWAPGRAQRLGPSGIELWSPGGVTFVAEAESPAAVTDGADGIVIVYQVTGADGYFDLHAQRLSGSGSIASGWPTEGVAVSSANRDQTEAVLASDGVGGAIAAWRDRRQTLLTRSDIYATRISGAGAIAPGWSPDGLVLCSAPGDQVSPSIQPDGRGGALVCWQDRRTSPTCLSGPCGDDVRAARVLEDGQLDPSFAPQGGAISTAAGNQTQPATTLLAPGVVGVVWADGRMWPDCEPWCTVELYAQRVPFDAVPPAVVSLAGFVGRTNAALAWLAPGDDGTAGDAAGYDIRYADSPITPSNFTGVPNALTGTSETPSGTLQCVPLEGLTECTRYWAAVRTRDAEGNWSAVSGVVDFRTDCEGVRVASCEDVLAAPGAIPPAASRFVSLAAPEPNPAPGRGSGVRLRFEVGGGEFARPVHLEVYDVAGRLVRTLLASRVVPGVHELTWDLRSDRGQWIRAGHYVARLRSGDRQASRTIIVR